MKRIFWLAMVVTLFSFPAAWAEDPQAPVPIPVDNGTDVLPPPIDLSQITPLPLPGSEKNETKPEKITPPPPKPAETPIPLMNTPTPPPVPAKEKKDSAPTPTAKTVLEPSSAAQTNSTTAPPETAEAGGALDYFPITEGSKTNYEYLKAAPGATAKKTRLVECMGREQMTNGTLRGSFQVTEDGKTVVEKYSLVDNKVQRTALGTETLTDDFAFQLPKAGGLTHWTQTGADGTVKSLKASFGQAEVYKKVYPDCVMVTAKTLKGGKAISTVISYFAKGVGLVAVEVYSAGMKLNQAQSIALVQQ